MAARAETLVLTLPFPFSRMPATAIGPAATNTRGVLLGLWGFAGVKGGFE